MATPDATLCPMALDPSAKVALWAAAGAPEFIRGMTPLYPILGSPIAQVGAPMLFNALFARTGCDAAVVPIAIAAPNHTDVLDALFRARNVPGALLTIPHQVATVALLGECSDAIRIADPCNTIVRRANVAPQLRELHHLTQMEP